MTRPDPPCTREECLAPVRKWTRKRKQLVCRGIHIGLITAIEAMQAHKISAEELNNWYVAYRNGHRAPLAASYHRPGARA